MSNHLEDLVGEWLEYNGYFVRKSVLVGPRSNGGFEGELDVVGFNPLHRHVVHIECSLDADPWARREARFEAKFARGRKHIPTLFHGLEDHTVIDQVALLQLGGGDRAQLGGGRLIWVSDFVRDILDRLAPLSPNKRAVPSTLPLLRTLQLAAQRTKVAKATHRPLIPVDMIS